VEADRVNTPGYYWSERLRKLARLQVGEKLPRGVGPWEFVAGEGEGSSSQVARRLFDRYPGMNVNEFTYTTTSPLARRLPMGDRPAAPSWWAWASLGAAALAFLAGRASRRRVLSRRR
jgi:hypothetical protein